MNLKPIPGCSGYFASEDGEIYSLKFNKTKKLAVIIKKNGHNCCAVRTDEKRIKYTNIGRLVCEAFHGTRSDEYICNHIDGNVSNNTLKNLEWKLKRKDITGIRFGSVIATSYSHADSKFNSIWNAKCDCGKELKIQYGNLTENSKCRKCAIKKLVRKKFRGESGFNHLFLSYKKGARNRNLEFNLDKPTFKKLTSSNCTYCGRAPETVCAQPTKNKDTEDYIKYIYNGVDRVNSDLGYTIDNVVPCCERCNRGKLDYSQEEFYDWIKKVYKHTFRGV